MSTTTIGVAVVELFTVIFLVWALVGVLRRPGWAWQASGRSKALWIVLLLIGFALPLLGIALAMWVIVGVLPQVDRQVQLGHGVGFPGGNRPR